MKKALTLIFILLAISLQAQENCKKRTLNTVEKSVIKDYFNEAVKNRWFINDIGIVVVEEDISKYPEKKWELHTYIDYSFRLDSTYTYALYHSDLILFKTISNESFPIYKKVGGCWDDVIADRLYIKPTKRNSPYKLTFDGWDDGKPILDANKKQRISPDRARRFVLDGSITDRVYVFSEKRGIIQKGRIP